FFWMSIRFGTSIDLSRRANVRRVREASTEAKTATPREGRGAAGVRGTCPGAYQRETQDSTPKTPSKRGRPTAEPALPGRSITPAGKAQVLQRSLERQKPASGSVEPNAGRWS